MKAELKNQTVRYNFKPISKGNAGRKRKAHITNADRFRSMSDEEQQQFVRWFYEVEDFADWLKQPHRGNTNE